MLEAATEEFREIEDKIETMRDPSHVKNLSKQEFLQLYHKHGYTIGKEESTRIPVLLKAWLGLTNTPEKTSREIINLMKKDIEGEELTGFAPYIKDNEIYFEQRWLLTIGIK